MRAFVHDAGANGRYEWYAREPDGAAAILRCMSAQGDIEIPSSIDGREVAEICTAAFAGMGDIVSIACPDGLTEIGARAFEGCHGLRGLSLPRGLDRFDSFWTKGCDELTELRLPGAIRSLDANILASNPPVRRVVIGPLVERVSTVFSNSLSIERVEIDPENEHISTDGEAVFTRDGSELMALLARVDAYDVPAGCRTIGPKAFAHCRSLKRVGVAQSVESIGRSAFLGSAVEEVRLPCTLREIGDGAFAQCRGLRALSLPEALESIGAEAFYKSGIEGLRISARVRSIGRAALSGTPLAKGFAAGQAPPVSIDEGNPFIVLDPQGALYLRDAGGDGSEGLILFAVVNELVEHLSPVEGTVRIAPESCAGLERLRRLTLPSTLASIGDGAFKNCRSLEEVDFTDELSSIGSDAFMEAPVRRFYVGRSLDRLGQTPFVCHAANRDVIISRLDEIEVSPDNKSYRMCGGILCKLRDDGTASAVMYCGRESTVELPREVVALGRYAFAGVSGIDVMRIHKGIRMTGVGSLPIDGSVRVYDIELAEPLDGRSRVRVEFPSKGLPRSGAVLTYDGGRVDASRLFRYADSATMGVRDTYHRAKLIMARLADPVCLSPASRDRFEMIISRGIGRICVELAERGEVAGFELLADLGFLTEGNIASVVDKVSASDNTAMTGYLLELRRRRFGAGAAALDFSL